MRDDVLVGCLLDDSWMTLEQAAAACAVEADWLQRHLDDGLIAGAAGMAGVWRLGVAGVRRARRMRALERDFDAVPELAALVADLLDELDALRQATGARRGLPPW